MSSSKTLVCDLEKDKADSYGYKDSYFCICHLPLTPNQPLVVFSVLTHTGKMGTLLLIPVSLYPCIPGSHPAACTLTRQLLCLKVQWPSESCSLRSPLGCQLSINISQTFPGACWHMRSFLPPGPLGKQQAASVLCCSAAHNVWPGLTCLGLFLPKLIE